MTTGGFLDDLRSLFDLPYDDGLMLLRDELLDEDVYEWNR